MLNQFPHPSLALRLLSAVLLVGTLLSSNTAAQEKSDGAKALFYDPATGTMLSPAEKQKKTNTGRVRVRPATAEKVKYPGIHYWIELEGHGAVTDDHIFRTGDRIKLCVRGDRKSVV